MLDATFGYMTAEELGIQNNIVILPCGAIDSRKPLLWKADELAPYANYMPAGVALDSMFGGFVFKPVLSDEQRFFDPMYAGFQLPANQADWSAWIRHLLGEGVLLHALAEASSHHPDIWIALPYPHRSQRDFGRIGDHSLDFSRQSDRLQALEWWIDEWLDAWGTCSGLHGKLQFRGFVWPRDSINGDDAELAPSINMHVHARGLKSIWTTNYGSVGVDQWKALGFDAAVIHSNYTGAGSHDISWLQNACLFAKAIRTGILIVKGKGVIYSDTHFDDYLRYGLSANQDYMASALKVYAFPNHSLNEWKRAEPEQYDKLYRFIKGTYSG